MLKAILSLATIAIFSFMKLAMAADIAVGWDQSTDLAAWASSQTFRTGDNLIFSYTTNHDVIEVSEDDFGPCNAANPLEPPHTGGNTIIPLTSAGNRYFICGTAGHCIGGMKLQVTTIAASAPPPSASAPPPAATPAPPTSTPSAPPTTSARPPVSSSPPKSTAPDESASSPPPAPAVRNPTTPPATSRPQSPSTPSSAAKINVMSALLIACFTFLMVICFNL